MLTNATLGMGSPDVSLSFTNIASDANKISDLTGKGVIAGGSLFITSSLGGNDDGIVTKSLGVSVGTRSWIPEIHAENANTWQLIDLNPYISEANRRALAQAYFDDLSCERQQYLIENFGVDLIPGQHPKKGVPAVERYPGWRVG